MWVNRIFLLIPQLILVPYLIGTIGEAGYGVYVLAWSLLVTIDQLETSSQQGVVKYSAAFLAQKQINRLNKIVSSSLVYSTGLAFLTCLGILVAAAFYSSPSGKIIVGLVAVGIVVLLIVPLTPYIAVIQSKQLYYVGALAETVSKYIGLFILVIWFHTIGPSVESLIIIMVGLQFLSRLAQVPLAYRLVPGLRCHPRLFDGGSLLLIAQFGAAAVLVSLCLAANSTGIRWLMGMLVSTSFVAHLAIILMPGELLSEIVLAMTITVMPATSAYQAMGNQPMMQKLLIRGMRYTTILVLAGLLMAGFLMRNVLSVWVGTEYVFLAPYALVVFASGAFMLSTSTSHHRLKGLGKLREVVLIYLSALFIVPVGTILGVFQSSRNPYLAITVGLVAGHLVCGFLNMVFCARAVRANLWEVIMRVYAQPLVVALISWLILLVIVMYSGLDGFIERIYVSVLAMLIFFGGCYIFAASADERRQLRGMATAALSKLRKKYGNPI